MTTVLVTLLAIVVVLLVVVVVGLLRSRAGIGRALRDLGVAVDRQAGTTGARHQPDAPRDARPGADIAGLTPEGAAVRVEIIGASHPTMLVFLTSTCTTCAAFWRAFGDVGRLGLPGDARLVAVTKGEEAESAPRVRRVAPSGIEVVMSTAAWDAYGAVVAPHFAYVEAGAVVAEGPASSWDDVVSMCSARVRVS